MITPIELDPGRFQRELPVDFDLFIMSELNESQDFGAQLVQEWNATVQTLEYYSGKLDFNHIEPTGRLGGIEKFKALSQGKAFLRWQMFVKGV